MSVKHALGDYAASNTEGIGAVRRYKPCRMAEITDGTSHTLLVGDKRLNRTQLGKWQEDDNEGYTAGWDEDTIRSANLAPTRDHVGSGVGGDVFGSSHPSGECCRCACHHQHRGPGLPALHRTYGQAAWTDA